MQCADLGYQQAKHQIAHRRRQEFYYFDFGWGTLIHFPGSLDKFVTFSIQFSNFGEGTFPMFPHPGGAYDCPAASLFRLTPLFSGNSDPTLVRAIFFLYNKHLTCRETPIENKHFLLDYSFSPVKADPQKPLTGFLAVSHAHNFSIHKCFVTLYR